MPWDYKLPPEQANLPATRQQVTDLWKRHHELQAEFNAAVEILEAFTGKQVKNRIDLKQRLHEAEMREAEESYEEHLRLERQADAS